MRRFRQSSPWERRQGFLHLDIDPLDGVPLQSTEELGTPQSHGCVRQKRADAIALREFADLGTTVVVTA